MNPERFDTLIRALPSRTSRRGLIPLLGAFPLGGTLGSLPGPAGVIAKSGTCKPACGVCQTCQKGKCSKKRGKKKCRPGVCRLAANDTACNGTGKCASGTCNPQPTCTQSPAACTTDDPTVCCSDVCIPVGFGNVGFCLQGEPGKECITNGDCFSVSCIGYRCQ
jgi:hypothetical protein